MNLYTVGIREVHIRYIDVQAESEEEARDLASVLEGFGVGDLQYAEELHKSTWDVLEIANDTD